MGIEKKLKKHEECSICKNIPDSASAFWKGGELQSSSLPAAESKLEIIGAPFYKDDTCSSHSIVKRCPECGTFYKWENIEYFFESQSPWIALIDVIKYPITFLISNLFFFFNN